MSYAPGEGGLSSDDLDRASRDSKIRDQAMEWFRKTEPEISALAGREATAKEKAIAQLIIMGELGAKMYGDIRKEEGAPVAKELLKEGFAIVGAMMRRNGEDVRMTIQVEFADVAAPKGLKPLVEMVKSQPVCECIRDEDGRCEACMGKMRRFFGKMGDSVRIAREARQEDSPMCIPCARRHMDGVLAEFVRTELALLEHESAEALLQMLFLTSQSLQAMSMPLTMKAWDELAKRNG